MLSLQSQLALRYVRGIRLYCARLAFRVWSIESPDGYWTRDVGSSTYDYQLVSVPAATLGLAFALVYM